MHRGAAGRVLQVAGQRVPGDAVRGERGAQLLRLDARAGVGVEDRDARGTRARDGDEVLHLPGEHERRHLDVGRRIRHGRRRRAITRRLRGGRRLEQLGDHGAGGALPVAGVLLRGPVGRVAGGVRGLRPEMDGAVQVQERGLRGGGPQVEAEQVRHGSQGMRERAAPFPGAARSSLCVCPAQPCSIRDSSNPSWILSLPTKRSGMPAVLPWARQSGAAVEPQERRTRVDDPAEPAIGR